jgi:hypothetical protein
MKRAQTYPTMLKIHKVLLCVCRFSLLRFFLNFGAGGARRHWHRARKSSKPDRPSVPGLIPRPSYSVAWKDAGAVLPDGI